MMALLFHKRQHTATHSTENMERCPDLGRSRGTPLGGETQLHVLAFAVAAGATYAGDGWIY